MANRWAAWRGRGALAPGELAEAAVLADVCVALIVIGWLLPGTGVFIAAAMVPMAAIAARHRPRAVVASGVAGSTIGMLIAGTGLASNVVACAVVGALLGVAWRRRWGVGRMMLVAAGVFWPVAAIAADGALSVFSRLRTLSLTQITNLWGGAKVDLKDIGLVRVAQVGDPIVKWMVAHWAIGVPGALLVGLIIGAAGGRLLAWPALDRLQRARPIEADTPLLGEKGQPPPAKRFARASHAMPEEAGPVPVELVNVGHVYPGMARPALEEVSLTVEPGQFVAVVGANGSGKSTLVRILAGRPPTSGVLRRPGSAAPGRPGGTAMIFQRPESQVLGVRVRDDVVWGLPRNEAVDVDALLRRVGLDGFGARETSTLSGGELQRLAVASALARRPRLLISDEATAMVDAEGRALLTNLLAALAADEGIAVVHVTHRMAEAKRADRTLFLDQGRLVEHLPPPVSLGALSIPCWNTEKAAHLVPRVPATGSVELSGVGHVYTPGSPWAHRALSGIDLTVGAGEGVMVLGRNGSGKSTLAWILAGLLVPTEGQARLDGQPIDQRLGEVALSFQHARLQLLRRTVRSDVRAASGVDAAGAEAALALVGLDPADLGGRSVDQLSGGQQRRVALAGMLARNPRVLVLDEPFAGLDDDARRGLVAVLARLRREVGLTLIVVSHDTDGAEQLVERVVTLDRGQVVADTPVHELTERSSGGPQ